MLIYDCYIYKFFRLIAQMNIYGIQFFFFLVPEIIKQFYIHESIIIREISYENTIFTLCYSVYTLLYIRYIF